MMSHPGLRDYVRCLRHEVKMHRKSASSFRKKAVTSSRPWMTGRFTFTKTACSTQRSNVSTSATK
jgi:hypothetical protein